MKKRILGIIGLAAGLSASYTSPSVSDEILNVRQQQQPQKQSDKAPFQSLPLIVENRKRLIERERGFYYSKYNRKGRLKGTPNKRILERIMSIPFARTYNKSLQM